jgi:RNA polymerase sigma-70 factor (ECF subfamily)
LEPDDDALVQRAGRGDHEACRRLVERHLARVVGFARRTLGDRTEAEDVAQDVFLRLWRQAPRWRPGGARLSTWLHTVALNLCRDRLARRRETHVDELPEVPDPGASPPAQVHGREVRVAVTRVLQELPLQQRAAIVLCHYQGFGNAEAALVLDVSVEAVESLLARGRRTLRARLRDLAPELLGDA